jgi:hypothetical protein
MKFGFLPIEQLQEVLSLPEEKRKHLIIQTLTDFKEQIIICVRGNFEPIKVSFSFFTPSGDGTAPNFSDVRPDDYGHTVVLGSYEAATDAILSDWERRTLF